VVDDEDPMAGIGPIGDRVVGVGLTGATGAWSVAVRCLSTVCDVVRDPGGPCVIDALSDVGDAEGNPVDVSVSHTVSVCGVGVRVGAAPVVH